MMFLLDFSFLPTFNGRDNKSTCWVINGFFKGGQTPFLASTEVVWQLLLKFPHQRPSAQESHTKKPRGGWLNAIIGVLGGSGCGDHSAPFPFTREASLTICTIFPRNCFVLWKGSRRLVGSTFFLSLWLRWFLLRIGHG